jgi:SAM-dependent methyltransferase
MTIKVTGSLGGDDVNKVEDLLKITTSNNEIIAKPATKQRWCRVVMNQDTYRLINQLAPHNLNVLEISGHAWKNRPGIKFKSYQAVNYPAFDICKDTFDEPFDLIIAEQVFEHLLTPYQAAKNVFSMLKPGGHFLITLPFFIKLHPCPTDCTRWSEMGLKYFLSECGFDLQQIYTASWGNSACVTANFYKWEDYNPQLHSLKNEKNFPLVVWALAKK